jgi:hypothetical protein
MANNFDISPLNPLKFYALSDSIEVFNPSNTNVYNAFDTNLNYRAFDADYFVRNIPSWQQQRFYAQPYQHGDMVNIQFLGIDNIPSGVYAGNPYTAYLLNCENEIVGTYSVTTSALALIDGQRIRECFIPLYDLDEGYYRVVIRRRQIAVGDKRVYVISEPIHVLEQHPESVLIKYKNSKNTQGIIFESGIEFQMRLYGVVHKLVTESKFTTYEDEPLNLTMLSGTPYRTWTFEVGGQGQQVPEWIGDKIERLTLCDSLLIDTVYYTRAEGAKLEVSKKELQPLCTYKLLLRERYNDNSLYQEQYQKPVIMNQAVMGASYIYVNDLTYNSTSTQIRKIFRGVNNILGFLNGYIRQTLNIGGVFGLNPSNEIVFIASSTTEYGIYDDITIDEIYWYGMKISLDVPSSLDLKIDLIGTSKYVFLEGNGTPIVKGTTPITIGETYAVGRYTAYLCLKTGVTDIDYSASGNIITAIDGELPDTCETFTLNNNVLKRVTSNLFKFSTSALASVLLNGNSLISSYIDKILKWLYLSTTASNITVDLTSNNPPSDQVRDVIVTRLEQLGNDIQID